MNLLKIWYHYSDAEYNIFIATYKIELYGFHKHYKVFMVFPYKVIKDQINTLDLDED